MSSVDDPPTSSSSHPTGGNRAPFPKPRRRPPPKPVPPYKPKVPMIPPLGNGSTPPIPDTRYEPVDLCVADDSNAQREPDTDENLANRPRMKTPDLDHTPSPDPLSSRPRLDTPKGTLSSDPLWDRPRLGTPTGSVPSSPIGCQERTSSPCTESYEVATIIGRPPSVEQYSEVSQRGLKRPPSPFDPSKPPITGQVDPVTEYNVTTHTAANRVQPPVPHEYACLDRSNSPRRDMPTDLGYTEIDVAEDCHPQLVHQRAGYSSLNNSAGEGKHSHAPKDGSGTKTTPTSRGRPSGPKPNLPPKPSNLRKSMDLSDTSSTRSVSPMSLSSAQAVHPTPRYETSETFGDDADKQLAPPKSVTRVRNSGQVAVKKNPAVNSVNSHCEVDIDEIIRRKSVKEEEEGNGVQLHYEGVNLKEVQEKTSGVEPVLSGGWEEPVMPDDGQEQQEIMDVIDSYKGTSNALKLEDVDLDLPFGETNNRASPNVQPNGDSRPSSLTRPLSTDSSEVDDEKKEASRPRRKAPLPPPGQKSSPVLQMKKLLVLETQQRQSLTLGRVPQGGGDLLELSYESKTKKSVPSISPRVKSKWGNPFKKKKESSKIVSAMPVSMDTKARSSTLPIRKGGKSANQALVMPRGSWDEYEVCVCAFVCSCDCGW